MLEGHGYSVIDTFGDTLGRKELDRNRHDTMLTICEKGSICLRADRVKELVREYYAKYAVVEWERLVKHPYHRLEFDTTMHFLKKYLPKKGLVLDAGDDPGRYNRTSKAEI
jgi:hypothetical protein